MTSSKITKLLKKKQNLPQRQVLSFHPAFYSTLFGVGNFFYEGIEQRDGGIVVLLAPCQREIHAGQLLDADELRVAAVAGIVIPGISGHAHTHIRPEHLGLIVGRHFDLRLKAAGALYLGNRSSSSSGRGSSPQSSTPLRTIFSASVTFAVKTT